MARQRLQSAAAWALAGRQHDAITRDQLLALGFSRDAIYHRVSRGRLHATGWRGVYAVGRPRLSREGLWMAAVLACGPAAVLSHFTAAALWGIEPHLGGAIEISVPLSVYRCRRGSSSIAAPLQQTM